MYSKFCFITARTLREKTLRSRRQRIPDVDGKPLGTTKKKKKKENEKENK